MECLNQKGSVIRKNAALQDTWTITFSKFFLFNIFLSCLSLVWLQLNVYFINLESI